MHYISKNFFINTHKICDFFFLNSNFSRKAGSENKKGEKKSEKHEFFKARFI